MTHLVKLVYVCEVESIVIHDFVCVNNGYKARGRK